MDQSCEDSNISLSPSKILDRLQVLRQLQILQRGKLQKHRLEYQESPETSSSITEIVSHFSNSTSYNTFRSLLQSSHETADDITSRSNISNMSRKVKDCDLVEGVTVLNLSQEAEFPVNSPSSSKNSISPTTSESICTNSTNRYVEPTLAIKKQIELDEMPILSPKQDFETLVIEKLKKHSKPKGKSPEMDVEHCTQSKKPFLKRGEGMARFGLKKNCLVIENTKSLPWRRKSLATKVNHTPKKKLKQSQKKDKADVQIVVNEFKKPLEVPKIVPPTYKPLTVKEKQKLLPSQQCPAVENSVNSGSCEEHSNSSQKVVQLPKEKHPLQTQKGKTWAAVLTKEQDEFLRQLKQSDYYKNFVSPAKSSLSDASCDKNLYKLRQEREHAEQNMFELLENKVGNESFNLDNSFFCKFLKRNLEVSGESTPLVMQKCLANNPALMHIFPDVHTRKDDMQSDVGTCNSEYTDCSEDCSSASCCCSCNTVEETQSPLKPILKKKDSQQRVNGKIKETDQAKMSNDCQVDKDTEDDTLKANMADMNAKLVATSELLKERLQELEDEVETFKNENANLAKMREEIDLERQKFYEEKNTFEQKYNEEKILTEYYLAEEKEKLTKQKQQYERYVREMRGRLNKKEKDEVISLKREISDLKEEIRIKDAKSTTTIARLRNQIKIMEKEKENLQKEVEKLKKENRRIQHSNEVTRRLTNLKYLEQINKKLTNMSKNTQSEVDLDTDVKYKAYEIERQSRSKRIEPAVKGVIRPRAKSVPNLKVTSRYAKYFSQRDAVSQLERNDMPNFNIIGANSDDDSDNNQNNMDLEVDDSESIENNDNSLIIDDDNNIEKMYLERFQSEERFQYGSFKNNTNRSSLSNTDKNGFKDNPDPYFIQKSLSKESVSSNHLSPDHQSLGSNNSKSPMSIISNRSGRKSPTSKEYTNDLKDSNNSQGRSRSPVSILSKSSGSQRSGTVINQEQFRDKLSISPEPSTSKTSLTKTNLCPTEIKKSDGSKELRFPNGNVKYISPDGKYTKFVYYNGDIKENFFSEGRIKYFYVDAKTYHTTHADGLEVLEFPE